MSKNTTRRNLPENSIQESNDQIPHQEPVHVVQEASVEYVQAAPVAPKPAVKVIQETPEELTRRKRKERLKTPIRGIFRFLQVPGGELKFPFKLPFKGEKVQRFTMVDGETYSIPLAVAIHLNKNCSHEVVEEKYDANGKLISKIQKMLHRTMFQPIEFMDIEELNPTKNSLSTVSL